MRPTPTLRTSAFSLANAAIALLCAYLCLMQDVSAAPAGATTTMHELPPRRGSHISTGFVRPALLVSPAPTSADRRGEKSASMSNASSRNRGNAGRRQGQQEVRSSGGLTDSYGLMNGMFDNECMQRHMNVREEKEQ